MLSKVNSKVKDCESLQWRKKKKTAFVLVYLIFTPLVALKNL